MQRSQALRTSRLESKSWVPSFEFVGTRTRLKYCGRDSSTNSCKLQAKNDAKGQRAKSEGVSAMSKAEQRRGGRQEAGSSIKNFGLRIADCGFFERRANGKRQ